jgi:Protein of unknown function (DUF4242)
MTSPRPFDAKGAGSAFLVERYLPPAAADGLAASVARVARLCADAGRSGIEVEYLYSTYLATEDTCFCLFRAHSSDAVLAINDEADFALDRITDAALLFPSESGTSEATDGRERSPRNAQSRKG